MSNKHYGYESSQDQAMHLDFWLTIGRGTGNQYNRRPSVKVTASYPSLARNQRAINIKMKLPMALFELPALTANIEVGSPAQAVTIDTTAIAEAVRGIIGMDVLIEVAEAADDEGEVS